MLTLHEIARALGGDVSGHSARVPGPGHTPADRSLSITLADNQDGFICHSFAGDDPIQCKDYIRERLSLPAFEPKRIGNDKARASEDDIAKAVMAAVAATSAPAIIEAKYDYTDADGTLLYQVLRLKPKNFRYRRPDANGGWVDGRGDRIVPYRLPELLKYPDGTVFVCEGEKDADRVASLDLCSTNVASGGWEQCAPVMTGRDVIILRDSDETGAKRALEAATALWGKAKTIRIVGMPDGAKDVSIWLDLDPGNAGKLADICFDVPPWEPSPEEQSTDGATISFDDFYAYMLGGYIYLPTGQIWPAASVNSRLPPVGKTSASAWLASNKPVEQMTWAPGYPMIIEDRLIAAGGFIARRGARIFNQYRPPTLKYGNPGMAGPWLDHVRKVYPADADHLIKWLAHRVQRPQEKINHALVLGGKQGIGKDTLLEPVKRAVGPWNFHEVSPQQMLGRFNAFLKSVILRVNEARDLGESDRFKFYDHTKSYITAPPDVLRVDEKHIHEYDIVNVVGVVITTNHKTDGIHLPSDDRRHFVAWSELSKDDFEPDYWTQLWRWYEAGGYGHVGSYLGELDLSGFDPKAPPPKTPAFWAIVDSSRAPEDAEMQDAIDFLGDPNPDALTINQLKRCPSSESFADYLGDRKNSRKIPHRLESTATPADNHRQSMT
jgi:hypothetical protein